MRRAAVAGLVLLALLPGYVLWTRSGHSERMAPTGAPADGAAGRAPGAAGGPGEETNAKSPGAPIRIQGTVTDASSSILTMEDGILRFRVDGTGEAEAPIREGEWEATAPMGAALTVEEIRFGDRHAVAVPTTVDVPEDGKVDVECRWVLPTLLRVIGEKGEHLRQVECRETGDADEWGPGWPAATAATSPIELAGAEGVHTYLLRAPGHAWSSVSVFVGFGGERVVRLSRAGTLEVQVSPHDPERGITVRVDTDCYWIPDETGRVRVDSLRAGDHRIFAQAGRGYEVVGEAEARVEAGKTTELTLPVGELPAEPEPLPLAGTIEVDRGWTDGDEATPSCMTPSISAWSMHEGVDVEQLDGRWSAGDVRPGRYGFRLDAWTWIQAVEVGPMGAPDVRLTVPAPCDVEVRLVDEETGEPIAADDAIAWCARAADVGEELLRCWYAEDHGRPEYPTEPGVYRFRAPRGLLHAWYFQGDLEDPVRQGDVEVELKPGLNQVLLRVAWILSADFAFKDGAMPVPADDGFVGDIEVASLRGGGAEKERYEMRGRLRVHFTKPGRYRVSFPAIEGYEPVAPVEVDVAPGTIPRVEIPLRRRVR